MSKKISLKNPDGTPYNTDGHKITFRVEFEGDRKDYPMDRVFMEEVIICTKKRRGDGKSDPIRVITEVFTKDGKLIAEFDPK